MELQLKLCLFNVENFFLSSTTSGAEGFLKPHDKIQWIARTIREIDADVTMLCEVGGLESLDLFNSKYLNSEYQSALLKGNSNRGIEMGYLIKKSFPFKTQHLSHANASIEFNYAFEIEENKKLLLDELKTPPHKFSRDISELRILKDDKVAMILLLVHLKSKWDRDGVDWNGKERRKAELKALVKTYNRLRGEFPGVPVVVAGDMNGQAQRGQQEPEFDDLYAHTDLDDILEVIQEPHERRLSFFYFGRENNRESFQLDYIFLPPELHSLVKKEDSGIYLFRDDRGALLPYPQESYQRYALPSDHYPVVATLNFLSF